MTDKIDDMRTALASAQLIDIDLSISSKLINETEYIRLKNNLYMGLANALDAIKCIQEDNNKAESNDEAEISEDELIAIEEADETLRAHVNRRL